MLKSVYSICRGALRVCNLFISEEMKVLVTGGGPGERRRRPRDEWFNIAVAPIGSSVVVGNVRGTQIALRLKRMRVMK